MTENKEQQNISYEELMDDMQSRFGRMLENYEYNGYEYATKFDALEDLVCDLVDDGSDEQERLAQEASDKVLRDFSRMLPDTEVGGQSGGSRLSSGAVPDISVDNLPILTSPLAPGIVTRGYLCNSSPNPPIPGSHEVTPKIKHGGFDGGAKNSFFGTWNPPDFVTLMGSLETGKTNALSTRQSNPDAKLEPEFITLAGRDVVVYPTGSRIGVYYEYHIAFEGFDVFIHKDIVPKNDNPQIKVDYRSEAILKYGGLYQAQSVLLDFLSGLGFTKLEEKVSRLDIQVMIDVPVSAFTKLYLGDHDVGKGRNFTINGKKKRWGKLIETFVSGDISRVQLCIYDKRLEIDKKYNAETAFKYDKTKKDIGREWWDDKKRPVTRIEFRLGRDALRALGVDSLEDFRLRERAIVEYLTHEWFRLLEKEKVRGMENEAPIHPLWRRVQNLFKEYFCCGEISEVKWEKPTPVSVDGSRLIKQGIGCFANAAGSIYGIPASQKVLKDRMCGLVGVDDNVFEKCSKKVRTMEIRQGIKFTEHAIQQCVEQDRVWERFNERPVLHLRR